MILMDDLSKNFCGLTQKCSQTVVRLTSVSHASEVIAACREAGQTMNLRGAGHGSGDRNIGSGTLLLNGMKPSIERLSESRFRVSSAITWLELERELNAMGRAAPVLTNWPSVTVGGTLAAGGFGSASLAFGAQVDWVKSLRVVLPSGSAVSINEEDPRFALMCCAQGVHGFIAEAELVTRACPGPLNWSEWQFTNEQSWLAGIDTLLAQIPEDTEHLVAQARWGRFGITAATKTRHVIPLTGVAPRVSQPTHADWREGLGRRKFSKEVVNPWSDFVLPAATLDAFLSQLFADLACVGLQKEAFPRLRILFLDRNRAPVPRAHFAPHRISAAPYLAGVGVYFVLHRQQRDQIAAARGVLARCLARCRACNGRPYLPGWHEMNRPELEGFYPEAMSASAALRDLNDPYGLFNPGTMPPI